MERQVTKGITRSPEVVAIVGSPSTERFQGDDFFRFPGITAEQADKILELIPEIKEDTQNDSPTMVEFVSLAYKYPGSTIDGYVVGPNREDERVSFEGIHIPNVTRDQLFELMEYGADEFAREGDGVYMWWD